MENGIIYIDKAGLKDSITFHETEFEIVDGHYVNSGRNSKFSNAIKTCTICDLNSKMIKESGTGCYQTVDEFNVWENIFKPVEIDTIIRLSRDDVDNYISLNYNYVDNALVVNGRYCITKVKPVMSHFDYVHCGVEIISMSKRSMNKVFDVYYDCGVKIHFQDTDPIHLNYDDVDTVVERISPNIAKI